MNMLELELSKLSPELICELIPEQIARLIEILDLHGACDEGLRAKIDECILAKK